jgi:Ino eighty subunit 1
VANLEAAFNQNPVFSVLADDGASTPGRDRQSPSHGTFLQPEPDMDTELTESEGSARGRGKLAKSIIERDYPSDTDRTRSVSPPGSVYNTGKKATPNMRINTLLNDDIPASSPAPKGPGRGNWARNRTSGVGAAPNSTGPGSRSFKSRLDTTTSQDGQSPSISAPTFNGPHGFYLPLNGSDPSHKRTRPLTQHQLAVEQYRRRRVDVILDRGIRIEYKAAAKRRRRTNTFMRAWIRCKAMADGYDTDEESHAQAQYQQDIEMGTKTPPPMPAGLVPLDFGEEVNDFGEESYYRAKMLGRALRRLQRWEDGRVSVRSRRQKRNGIAEYGDEGSDEDDEEGEGEGDVDMQDQEQEEEEELRREEESESSDEEMDVDGGAAGGGRYDGNELPSLASLQA